ncbi:MULTISPECIES: flagellar basal body P-ring formation chaperone FlgA [Rhizobium]|uniref:Flagella basal body P-ring formation protein FlgA n=1 Tax=Rhizobium rhododendri TaxID=2506430 RepID=A0ABY8IJE6_9HYPH|nr:MULTISPECIES: flagellar basal body P-ring formation chaperone FlgA [Rhizobium]MBO9097274.1 flagellar basal body P-ring formation protein FlgA [Rhizobium sp. L58/93]MBO9133874.1 flagellar basal body P-ring formation protein FlgA [Rhizobium sp. B209b/85]MBO9167513.1 flagellar basal body P-ring formation protein FlgA [Rhizobium sp. L245/93]MBO9183472.1 flagellar basal body P-ring formation protein FlgA [Rhizobium sp. E27B/91]MBZ5760381.1 flagellar basal body P-ring formation protein FlgA [Rhiz
MIVRQAKSVAVAWLAVVGLACGFVLAPSASAEDLGMGKAVVPTEAIYPGDVISSGQLEEVQITNPNLTGDFARSIDEVVGRVSKRTLLSGRTIAISALRQPFAVTRGSNVRLVMSMGDMMISAAGTPLDDGSIGDKVRARNIDSGIIVNGTVLENGTIRVVAK